MTNGLILSRAENFTTISSSLIFTIFFRRIHNRMGPRNFRNDYGLKSRGSRIYHITILPLKHINFFLRYVYYFIDWNRDERIKKRK